MNAYAAFDIETVFSPADLFANFGALATTIITVLVSFAGALSIIFIIIAGFKFVTSSGDEKKLASASSTLTYAIIGLAVTILAFVILRIVQHFIGSNVEIT
ncbi:hypothetical protein A2W45_01415 [Candidatus Curtissbacteria bacterium RIFCSPHIGHO2_12_41_11]|uniref:DUF4190 domain-containing protein n=3 Tax=Candidatus Curtissiibacteriota TaxID=1752717 RepID=A0A1F5HS26_9BACT|nr:MAG: hypothetical protein UU56_C0016G0011 [Candidatus Curtissbacteria bacterium GW2011_GWA2_41_24]OGE00045.1 MAG: hypothetical protein A2W45_01415 [Candidatus Curtissbacteria bacterium RIFCSPHIGHO2_12_41_11]OGE06860.1 MAG: hypothetical protein A2W70_01505 [Candidatus Curtissbacteria bacterium RIFCSPLOWO2_02_41_11]